MKVAVVEIDYPYHFHLVEGVGNAAVGVGAETHLFVMRTTDFGFRPVESKLVHNESVTLHELTIPPTGMDSPFFHCEGPRWEMRIIDLCRRIDRIGVDAVIFTSGDAFLPYDGVFARLGPNLRRVYCLHWNFCHMPLNLIRAKIGANAPVTLAFQHHDELDDRGAIALGSELNALLTPVPVGPLSAPSAKEARSYFSLEEANGNLAVMTGSIQERKGLRNLLAKLIQTDTFEETSLACLGLVEASLHKHITTEYKSLLSAGRLILRNRILSEQELSLAIRAADVVIPTGKFSKMGLSDIAIRSIHLGANLIAPGTPWFARLHAKGLPVTLVKSDTPEDWATALINRDKPANLNEQAIQQFVGFHSKKFFGELMMQAAANNLTTNCVEQNPPKITAFVLASGPEADPELEPFHKRLGVESFVYIGTAATPGFPAQVNKLIAELPRSNHWVMLLQPGDRTQLPAERITDIPSLVSELVESGSNCLQAISICLFNGGSQNGAARTYRCPASPPYTQPGAGSADHKQSIFFNKDLSRIAGYPVHLQRPGLFSAALRLRDCGRLLNDPTNSPNLLPILQLPQEDSDSQYHPRGPYSVSWPETAKETEFKLVNFVYPNTLLQQKILHYTDFPTLTRENAQKQSLQMATRLLCAGKRITAIASPMRSGSTLLKALLANNPEVSHLPEVDFRRQANKGSLLETLAAMSEARCLIAKKPRWYGERDYPDFHPDVAQCFLLVRSPLGCINSLKKMGLSANKHFDQFLDRDWLGYWIDTVDALLGIEKSASLPVHWIIYEELISDPVSVSRSALEFIGVDNPVGYADYQPIKQGKWFWGSDDGGDVIQSLKVRQRHTELSERHPVESLQLKRLTEAVNELCTRIKSKKVRSHYRDQLASFVSHQDLANEIAIRSVLPKKKSA